MVYLILILILAFVFFLFTLAGSEGKNYSSKSRVDAAEKDDHFNSFTL